MVHTVALLLVVLGLISDAGRVANASASPFGGTAIAARDDGRTCAAAVRLAPVAAEADDLRDAVAAPFARFMPSPQAEDAFVASPSHSAESHVTQPPDRPPRRRT